MKKIISFSGKGGVGKSTLLVLMLKYLLEKFKDLNILVIDADPDANIGDIIGKDIHFKETVGGKMAELKRKIQKRQIPLEVSKDQIVESEVFEALIEMDLFDILEMGRSEGEGCYCSINNYLKRIIDILAKNYDIVLIDAPAGLEYFARKTGRTVTDLVIVSDPSKMGIHTMKRILEVSKEVDLRFENIWILGNRFPENSLRDILEKEVANIKEEYVKLLGFIENSDEISRMNIVGENLLDLPNESKPYKTVKQLYSTII
ncbi:MAG: ATP-binding protein [Promethearchaeota archaeon Loki_b32]|nr:MAG: ATP-binding protein [Candidatus Lokiarchaeota archaeon Loki_b32]